MKILVNDGIEDIGKQLLEEAGFDVDLNKIAQEDLMTKLNEYDAICVRSATKVRKELMDAAPNLKVIARGGVGLDNIDVEYAKSKGIRVINTPAASSRSVAELAMAHLLSLVRMLHLSHKQFINADAQTFNTLKKSYAKGIELEGKTLGIIGFGRIGQEMASVGLGLGMNILAYDPYVEEAPISIGPKSLHFKVSIKTVGFDDVVMASDVISLHTPSIGKPILGTSEFEKMKEGVIILNAGRGGLIDESALINAISNGTVFAAGLDVFENEPTPDNRLINNMAISVTPHIGASTIEAQNKIGIELAEKVIEALKR